MPELSERSLRKLSECDDRLKSVVLEAQRHLPFEVLVTCGHRNKEDQDVAYARGVSGLKWPHSRHNKMPSLAVDLAPLIDGAIPWNDLDKFRAIAAAMKEAAKKWMIPGLAWGGDWRKLVDMPHFQVPRYDENILEVPKKKSPWDDIEHFRPDEFPGIDMDIAYVRQMDKARAAAGYPFIVQGVFSPSDALFRVKRV